MVLVNGNKYACETCIKGHRSSTCRHTDRPLFEIKKKGRPVTQCDHCRELRKTKQVHVKCSCEGKEDLPPGPKKGHPKIPSSAAFPQGLPPALGAQVAFAASEGPSDDSSDSGGKINKCGCKSGASCNCCIPRKGASKKKKDQALASGELPSNPSEPNSIRTTSHILARLAELRPVLPRPSHLQSRLEAGSSHNPSSGIAHGHNRQHSHDNFLFSPYGRAYEHVHEQTHPDGASPNSQPTHLDPSSQDAALDQCLPISDDNVPNERQMFSDQFGAVESSASSEPTWIPAGASTSEPTISFPSACNCGDGCSCPGCVQHNGDASAPSPSAFSTCTNPSVCTSCMDCTIMSLPISLPPDTALSIYDAYPAGSLDNWIRQVSSLAPPDATLMDLQYSQQQWDRFLLPVSEPSPAVQGYSVKPCCGVLCKCDPETCECNVGSQDGYDCRNEMLFPTFPSAMSLEAAPVDLSTTTLEDGAVPRHFKQENAGSCGVLPAVPTSSVESQMRSQSADLPYSVSSTAFAAHQKYLSVPVSEPARSRSLSTSSHGPIRQPPIQRRSSHGNGDQFSSPAMFGYLGPSSMTMSSPNLHIGLGSDKMTQIIPGLDMTRNGVHNGLSRGSSPTSSTCESTSGHSHVQYAASSPDSDVYI